MPMRGVALQRVIGRWLPRHARHTLPVGYAPLLGAAILSLTLLSPLLCIIHCALLHQPHHLIHAHHEHQHGHTVSADSERGGWLSHYRAVAASAVSCAPLAASPSSEPLPPPMPQALYELLALYAAAIAPLVLSTTIVILIAPAIATLCNGPAPPPPRLA